MVDRRRTELSRACTSSCLSSSISTMIGYVLSSADAMPYSTHARAALTAAPPHKPHPRKRVRTENNRDTHTHAHTRTRTHTRAPRRRTSRNSSGAQQRGEGARATRARTDKPALESLWNSHRAAATPVLTPQRSVRGVPMRAGVESVVGRAHARGVGGRTAESRWLGLARHTLRCWVGRVRDTVAAADGCVVDSPRCCDSDSSVSVRGEGRWSDREG